MQTSRGAAVFAERELREGAFRERSAEEREDAFTGGGLRHGVMAAQEGRESKRIFNRGDAKSAEGGLVLILSGALWVKRDVFFQSTRCNQ